MASLNKVFLMGNLTRDPELRYTPSGTPVCEFGLAVNRQYTTRDGEQRDETCFVDVTMWGKRGVVISEYFQKGRPIFVEGRLKYDSWESADGRRSKLTVTAENFEFIGGRGGGGGESGGGRSSGSQGRGGRSRPEPEDVPDEGFDVADDEIPF
jgi:single-strand DNA-binding protein